MACLIPSEKLRPISPIWWAVGLFALALAVRLVAGVVLPLDQDEPYHILAARSWLSDGTFRLFEGRYTRTAPFTALVGLSIKVFGDSALGARMPSILSGALLVPLVFLWTRAKAGQPAAIVAALLLALSQIPIETSGLTRFYALQTLCIWIAATLIFDATERGKSRWRTLGLALAAVLLVCALKLQVTTLVAVAGLGLWAALDGAWRFRARLPWRWVLLGAAALALFAVILLAVSPLGGMFTRLIGDFRSAEYWARDEQNNIAFYHRELRNEYSLLWPLLPATCVLAIFTKPRLGTFCSLLALFIIGVMSFGGMKAPRYILPAYPFLFVVWALAIVAVARPLWALAQAASARALQAARVHAGPDLARWVAGATLAICVAFAVLSQLSFYASLVTLPRAALRFAAQPDRYLPYPQEQPWRSPEILQAIRNASLVVTSNELFTLMFIGRYDVHLSRDLVEQTPERSDFAVDPRTGRPVISTAQSLKELMDCYPNGVALVEGWNWRNPHGVNDEASDLLLRSAKMERIGWPGAARAYARSWSDDDIFLFRWDHAQAPDGQCARVRALVDQRGPTVRPGQPPIRDASRSIHLTSLRPAR
jgi:4-amino-4-deoxy-L-arabinose transferase-like glycosyltransferase